MARIKWIEDADASGPAAAAFAEIRANSQSGAVADILRTMSLRPDFMLSINDRVSLALQRRRADTRTARANRIVCRGAEPLSLLTEHARLVPAPPSPAA
jgi:hypothetical protein